MSSSGHQISVRASHASLPKSATPVYTKIRLTDQKSDDDKYSAHTGLLGRDIVTTSSLQLLDRALSSPQSVMQDISGSNGQGCFVYTGKCIHLDNNDAMAQACGPGNTVVGWDDAGCGKKKCVSFPIKSKPTMSGASYGL